MAEKKEAPKVETPKEKKENLSLAEKLNRAISDIGPVKKDGNNGYQNYRFQSEAAIKAAVKKVIGLNGFDIIPSYEITNQRDVQGRKGTINHIVDVMGTFTITDGRKDQDIVGKMPGSGMDTGEKAVAKACTSAQKYFYKQLFNISDHEEDPDATNSDIGATYQQNMPQQTNRRLQQRQQSQQESPQEIKERLDNALKMLADMQHTTPAEVKSALIKEYEKEPAYKQNPNLALLGGATAMYKLLRKEQKAG